MITHPHSTTKPLDTISLMLAIMAATLVAVTFNAWRLGNERRDIALLGAVSGLLGIAFAVTTFF